MFSLIPQILLLVGFGLILWLVIKNLPKIKNDEVIGEKTSIDDRFEEGRKRIGKKIPIEKIDAKVNSFLEKFLRKSRIILMKIDAYLQRHLDALRKQTKPKSIFKTEDNLIFQEKIKEEYNLDVKNLEEKIYLESEEKLEDDINLIAGVDKISEDLLSEQENNQIIEGDDEVEVLVIGAEEEVKKLNLEPEGEIIEEKKKKKKRKKME